MGGGVGGINYTCNDDGSGLNYKSYNLRGDVILITSPTGDVLSQSYYGAFGNHLDSDTIPVDKYTANTKREENGLLNEGYRYRNLTSLHVFISPDPLEYVDGLNCYIYCNQNPWSKFDPEGLFIGFFVDMAFAAYDTYQYITGQQTGAEYAANMALTGASLAANTGSAGVAGLGVRGASLASKAIKAAKVIDKVSSAESAVESAVGAVESAAEGDYEGAALGAASAALGGSGKISKSSSAKNSIGNQAGGKGKGHKNIIEPSSDTDEAHSVYTRDQNGKINKYTTFKKQTNPKNPNKWEVERRFDMGDPKKTHYDKGTSKKITGPHIHEGKSVRDAKPDEIPGGK